MFRNWIESLNGQYSISLDNLSIRKYTTMPKPKEKSYKIQVPVFSTELIVEGNILFGDTYQNLINAIKQKINDYDGRLSFENKNKTQRTVVNNINCTDHTIGNIPCLLLRISAYSTNLFDGYFEDEKRHQFEKENRIGSDNNFVLIYPVITGLESYNYTRYFLILVYDDPNKEDSNHLIRIAKYIAKDILSIPIKNIKPQTVLEELEKVGIIPELQEKYYGIYHSENDVDVKYQEYLTSGMIKKSKTNSYKNMPFEMIGDLLAETDDSGEYQTKRTIFKIGKKEFRITRQLIKDTQEKYSETAEKVFNASIGITQSELENNTIYEPDYIVNKLSSVITNYVSSEIDNDT